MKRECFPLLFPVLLTAACGGDALLGTGPGARDGGSTPDGEAAAPIPESGPSTPETGPGDASVDPAAPIPESGPSTPETGSGDASVDPAAPLLAIYHATPTKTLASPLPDATGITYDGTFLWIFAPKGNPQLEQFDPSTVQAQRTFTVSPSFQSANAGGIAWDGTSIWVSVADETNELVQVDPTNGQILRSMGSPSMLGPTDLDFDGTDLWLSSGTGGAYRIDPTTGGVIFGFAVAGGSMGGRDNGIAIRTGQVFVGGLFGGIEIYDPATGNDLGAVVHDDGSQFQSTQIGPSVFVGSQFVVLSSLGITYYDIAKAP
jgi:hypothetical protein